jgi:hypothetical protein
MNLYRQDSESWQNQLTLWRRFSKRRSQDGEPDLRDLEPAEAVAAFITYLRGHLQRDMQDRTKPGCEIWSGFGQMVFHSVFIDKILKLLPPITALGRRLRNQESGEPAPPREPEVTTKGLRKKYNIPKNPSWMDAWTHPQLPLPASEPEPPRSPKRQGGDRSEADDARPRVKRQRDSPSQDDARPSKRPASHADKPSSAEPVRSTGGKRRPKMLNPDRKQRTRQPSQGDQNGEGGRQTLVELLGRQKRPMRRNMDTGQWWEGARARQRVLRF